MAAKESGNGERRTAVTWDRVVQGLVVLLIAALVRQVDGIGDDVVVLQRDVAVLKDRQERRAKESIEATKALTAAATALKEVAEKGR